MKNLQDGHVRFDGSQREFAAEVLAEGFGRDSDQDGDAVLRDAPRGEKTGKLAVTGSGLEPRTTGPSY